MVGGAGGCLVCCALRPATVKTGRREYILTGILCKHALRVFNTNRVYDLPSQYILPRWTKYAKSGFYIEKQGSEKEDLKTQAALISRQATSLALKCSPSKELLDKLQKALHSLNLEADTYLSEMHEKSNEVPVVSNASGREPLNGVISFRIPQVINGPKKSRVKNPVEKKFGNKKKNSAKKKGEDASAQTKDERPDPKQMIENHIPTQISTMPAPFMQDGYANPMVSYYNYIPGPSTMPAPYIPGGYTNGPSTMPAPYIPGGYTNLLIGVDQDTTVQSTVRRLHFDGVSNHENM